MHQYCYIITSHISFIIKKNSIYIIINKGYFGPKKDNKHKIIKSLQKKIKNGSKYSTFHLPGKRECLF